MTTRDDLDRVTRPWGEFLVIAIAIHQRDGHSGEKFAECPWPLCKLANEGANTLLSEYIKVNNRGPRLVQKLDMCAVAENLR